MSEHYLIRYASTMTFSAICPLQPTIDNMFIGGMQEIASHPKSYGMKAVVEMVEAYDKASIIATERTNAARKEAT